MSRFLLSLLKNDRSLTLLFKDPSSCERSQYHWFSGFVSFRETARWTTIFWPIFHFLARERERERERAKICIIEKKVQVGKDQEKAQSERDSHSKKPRWEKTKLTIRHLYHETYRKPNEQLFSQ